MRDPRPLRVVCAFVFRSTTGQRRRSHMSGDGGNALHKLLIAPTSLQDSGQLDYIDATLRAGYDGIGLRVHRSPGLPFHPVVGDAALTAEMKSRIADAGLKVFDLYSFYLQPDTRVADFAPAME